MFKHSFLLDRSRNTLSQLATIRRMHRVKAGVNNLVEDMKNLAEDFGQLPLCLRDEHLIRAIDGAFDNGGALNHRVEAWQFAEEEVVEGEVVKGSEEYLKKCIAIVEDLREAIRGLHALVAEDKKEADSEEDSEKDDKEKVNERVDEQNAQEGEEEKEEMIESEQMDEHDDEEEEDV